MTDDNGSAGRFGRMEDKLDNLVDSMANFREDTAHRFGAVDSRLTSIEAKALGVDIRATDDREKKYQDTDLRWVRLGVFASLLVGTAGLALALFVRTHGG